MRERDYKVEESKEIGVFKAEERKKAKICGRKTQAHFKVSLLPIYGEKRQFLIPEMEEIEEDFYLTPL